MACIDLSAPRPTAAIAREPTAAAQSPPASTLQYEPAAPRPVTTETPVAAMAIGGTANVATATSEALDETFERAFPCRIIEAAVGIGREEQRGHAESSTVCVARLPRRAAELARPSCASAHRPLLADTNEREHSYLPVRSSLLIGSVGYT